jgi:hypothetical protein
MMPSRPLDTILYRIALYLYPPAFREEYSEEMLLDFEAARRDAFDSEERGARRMLWMHMAVDLMRSIVVQWVRTGLPLITATAMTCSFSIVLALVCFWRAPATFPMSNGETDILQIVLLSTVVLLIVAGTIIFTTWFTRTTRRRREF